MDFNPFKHRISELNSLNADKGHVLVAEPFMQDQYFKRSVVLLCENNDEGTVGFILNQALDISMDEILKNELAFQHHVFLGGPVEPQNLFYIHRCAELEESLHITSDLYWSGNFEQLKVFMDVGKIKADQIRFFLGYSGWDKEQLDDEIEQQSWLITKLSSAEIFGLPSEELWKHSLQEMGKEQALLSTFPENPNLN